jgi:hypothetical protein
MRMINIVNWRSGNRIRSSNLWIPLFVDKYWEIVQIIVMVQRLEKLRQNQRLIG